MNPAPPPTNAPEAADVLLRLGRGNPAARRNRRIVQGVLFVLLASGGAFGIKKALDARRLKNAPTYETEPLKVTDISLTISATGTIEGRNTVEVGAEVSGRVTEVAVQVNDLVTKGQLLARLDPEQSRATVSEQSAQVLAADAAVEQAEATRSEVEQKEARAKREVQSGLTSPSTYEGIAADLMRAKAAVKSARANATLARASLDLARSRLGKTQIISPLSGIVLARLVEPGQTITAGMTTPVLFKITEDLRAMQLSIAIDEADIGHVRAGQSATFRVDAYPGREFRSEVLMVYNEPVTVQNVVTYKALLTVDNADMALRPGMTAAATILVETKRQVLSTPSAALRFSPPIDKKPAAPRFAGMPRPTVKPKGKQDEGPAVWILKGGAPSRVGVQTGASDGHYTELLGSALSPGAEVIVDAVLHD